LQDPNHNQRVKSLPQNLKRQKEKKLKNILQRLQLFSGKEKHGMMEVIVKEIVLLVMLISKNKKFYFIQNSFFAILFSFFDAFFFLLLTNLFSYHVG